MLTVLYLQRTVTLLPPRFLTTKRDSHGQLKVFFFFPELGNSRNCITVSAARDIGKKLLIRESCKLNEKCIFKRGGGKLFSRNVCQVLFLFSF